MIVILSWCIAIPALAMLLVFHIWLRRDIRMLMRLNATLVLDRRSDEERKTALREQIVFRAGGPRGRA